MALNSQNKDEISSVYYKCDGDIEVCVFGDGTEIYTVPDDYKWVSTIEDDGVSCPQCGYEEIHYHNGIYVCTNCECTFTEQELIDYCGCDIIHG